MYVKRVTWPTDNKRPDHPALNYPVPKGKIILGQKYGGKDASFYGDTGAVHAGDYSSTCQYGSKSIHLKRYRYIRVGHV